MIEEETTFVLKVAFTMKKLPWGSGYILHYMYHKNQQKYLYI